VLDGGEPATLAFKIHPAARSDLREPRIVNIVEPQFEPGDAQFGEEIETTDSRSDYRNRLSGALVRHGFLPLSSGKYPGLSKFYPASATGSIRPGSLFFTFPTRVLTGQQVISSAG
jgi:hypothetical protein